MYKNKKIAIIVPAYNEEKFIAQVIDAMPEFADKLYVVNDASTDGTLEIIYNSARKNNRVNVINREVRGGVGAAILSGHRLALKDNMDILAVMAGDGQMNPEILGNILDPIIDGKADYVKGNRLSTAAHRKGMPVWRAFGNILLTTLTRIASGYWNISDPQNGYTAMSAAVLKKLNLEKIETGYAFENDILVKLNVIGARVMDIYHPALYYGQHSKIHYPGFIIRTSWVLLKDWVWRIWTKYVIVRQS